MEKRLAKDFNSKVEELLHNTAIRLRFYEVLKIFHRVQDVANFVNELKGILSEPKLLPLFEDIRPLVPVHLQLEYDTLIPPRPSHKLRHVILQRRHNRSLGFSVRGGLEHGVGLYVSEVLPESQAEEAGLRVGDEVVTINGYSISQAIHQEALMLVKNKPELEMNLRYVGMLPTKGSPGEKLSWTFVQRVNAGKIPQEVVGSPEVKDVQLSVILPIGASLGCSIYSGPKNQPGIFIHSVKAGGLAEEAGLEVGDQLIDVNGTAFSNITHSQAIVALKGSRMLNLQVRKKAGFAIFGPGGSPLTGADVNQLDKEKNALNRKQASLTRKPASLTQKSASSTLKPVSKSPEPALKSQDINVSQPISFTKGFEKTGGEPSGRKYSSTPQLGGKKGIMTSQVSLKTAGSAEKPVQSLAGTEGSTIGAIGESSTLEMGVGGLGEKGPNVCLNVKKGRQKKGKIETENQRVLDKAVDEEKEVVSGNQAMQQGGEEAGRSYSGVAQQWDQGGSVSVEKGTVGVKEVISGNQEMQSGGEKTGRRYSGVVQQWDQRGTVSVKKEEEQARGLVKSHDTEEGGQIKSDAVTTERRVYKGLSKGEVKSGSRREGAVLTGVTRLDSQLSSQSRQTVYLSDQLTGDISDVKHPLTVDTTKTQTEESTKTQPVQPKGSPIAGTFLTDRQNPSFRIQKPVLLHPTRGVSGETRVATVPEEGRYPEGGFTEENWRPHRLFTNEQIAGRQVQLVTLQKSDSKGLCMRLELQFLSLGRPGLVVTQVTEGGLVHKQGGVHCGDELLMVNGVSIYDQEADKATRILEEEYSKAKVTIQLVVAKALPSDSTEQVTYF